jgi:iron(III) transport system permease protein
MSSKVLSKVNRPPSFLIVTAAIVAIAIALPLVYLVIRTAGVGAGQLWALLSRPQNLSILIDSTLMAAAVTACSSLIAVPLAFLTVRTDLPGRKFWLIVSTLPLAVPSYVGSFALLAAFGPRGSWLQLLLAPLGVEELPSIYGWTGAILSITLFTYPYLLLSVRAGLLGIDPAMEEASRSLGYNHWSTFVRITLPQLRPSLVAGGLLVALYALSDFGTPSLMQFNSFTRAIFLQYRASFNRNSAAALSLLLVALVLVILWLEYRMRTQAVYYTRGSAARRAPKAIKLGAWKWLALAFCTAIALMGLVLPVGTSIYWLWQGLRGGYRLPDLMPIALNSIWASGLGAIAATVFALPIAILSVRYPGRMTTTIERCSYIGFGLPGIVVALSLVFFGANYVPWLYQTIFMLGFAYLVLYLPQSVGTIRSSLLQVNPQLEESARSLGRTAWQTLQEITLPLVRPGVVSGAVLVFLTALKELPATMLLAPIGFNTLAIQIWTATQNVAFAEAAASSLTLLVVSFGSTLLVLSRSGVKI